MKKKWQTAVTGILFFIGLLLLLYPAIADLWNDYRQKQLIGTYEKRMTDMEEAELEAEWAKAQALNGKIRVDPFADVFGETQDNWQETEYWKVLNVSGNGIMGYLSIPKIQVRLSIYHGTGDEVLQTGAGHMNGSSLPIGGEGTHCTLVAHRGLPGAKLFTELDRMEIGDRFYIHILNQTFAYEVSEILPMVDKKDKEAIGEALGAKEGEDLVTLYTCTPYGVNTHRLLVTGRRIPYDEEKVRKQEAVGKKWFFQKYPQLLVLPVLFVAGAIFYGIKRRN